MESGRPNNSGTSSAKGGGSGGKTPQGGSCGCVSSQGGASNESITVQVTPTTGGQFELSVTRTESVENLKKLISKKLKVPKERICLLHRDKQLRDGNLHENQLVDGSRLTLLPSVETGLLAQRPEQSVMQALESLNDSQVNDFLSGKAPLNLTMRLGDHMMLIQLQLSTVTPTSSRRSASTTTSTSSSRSVPSSPSPSASSTPAPAFTLPSATQAPVTSSSHASTLPTSVAPTSVSPIPTPVSPVMPTMSVAPPTVSLSPAPVSLSPASVSLTPVPVPVSLTPSPMSLTQIPISPAASPLSPMQSPILTTPLLVSSSQIAASPAVASLPVPSTIAQPQLSPTVVLPTTVDSSPVIAPSSRVQTPPPSAPHQSSTTTTTPTSVRSCRCGSSNSECCSASTESHSNSSSSSNTSSPNLRPTLDTKALAEASRNLTQTLKQLSSEDSQGNRRRQGAIIESMHHHGKGVYSGTFSGTLNPALQDRFGRPKRDISTIIHILNDLLCAAPQYRRHSRPTGSASSDSHGTSSSSTLSDKSASHLGSMLEETVQLSRENQATRGKMEQLRLIMEERRARRRARREARVAPYSQWAGAAAVAGANSPVVSGAAGVATGNNSGCADPNNAMETETSGELCELNPEPVVA